MTQKTIRHGIFTWQDEGGSNHIAFHGQTVDIDKDSELRRGESEGAFFEVVGQEADRTGKLSVLSPEASDEEMKAWIVAGTTSEVLDQARTYPRSVAAHLAILEEQRIGSRIQLVEGLRALADLPEADEPDMTDDSDDDGGQDDPDGDDDPGDSEPETSESDDDLSAFVADNNIPAVVQRAGNDPELAARLLEIEQSSADPRKGLIEALRKINEG